MKKQILTDNETKLFLMKSFKCTRMTVWRALNFECDTDMARRIRVLAMQRGGKLTEGYIPDCETTHNSAQRVQEQTFGKRVKIIADRKTNEVTVWIDGKQHGETYRDLTVADFMQLQHETQQMAAAL